MRINRRLILLVSIPLAVAVAFSLRALAPAVDHVVQAQRLTQMVDAADAAGQLSSRLQGERAAATALVAAQGDEAAFTKRAEATDTAIAKYRDHREELSSVPEKAEEALQRVDRSLAELSSLRAQVRSGTSTLSALTFRYRITIADLINYRGGIAQADGVDVDLSDRIQAAAALSQAGEYLAQQQVVVQRALHSEGFTPAAQRAFDATSLGYTASRREMAAVGPQEWRSWLERSLAGPDALAAQRLEDEVSRTAGGDQLSVSAGEWLDATSGRLALLVPIERRVDGSVHDAVIDSRSAQLWWAVGEVALVLLTLVGALLVAIRLGRVMIRRLRELRNAAREVATKRLPMIVEDLSQPGALGGATPEQVAGNSGTPVGATGEDEIGEVGHAFNAVHYEAVRLAAQQAHVRDQFAETLVGVARRGAQLTAVMVSELDAVQRDEADPERMKVLFALDHLAVRMERNTNSLLVLGGYGNARVRNADSPCATVIVAAAQQIERFHRVTLGTVERGIGISARVVHDLAHILAELLDNATRFSPPDRQVGVAVWSLVDRAVVQIVDEGVGISPERREVLNARLAEPRADVGNVRSMGLQVVSRLATRHGIVVELRDSSGPGTIAEVTLPASVLVNVTGQSPADPQELGLGRPGGLGDGSVFSPRPGRPGQGLGEKVAAGVGTAAPSGAAGHEQPTAERADTTRRLRVPEEYDPAKRIAGTSSAGLPVRARQSAESWPRVPERSGPGPRAATAKKPQRRRDSRQISDVLAAYTRGVSRSTERRTESGGANPGRTANDDETQRSK
ncbi:sensor histidine kinase [Streptomyces sp. A7024]|uniref:histidine kinase n=1 Tax=Streptomyces coryli TaxID=1128680 RepID=A0A6G4TZW4_9ACTN|nr:sensor histidine kinase [Streptomyces coryli]NGN65292.1 sensor histidine kinase [Streptomyces coryli]